MGKSKKKVSIARAKRVCLPDIEQLYYFANNIQYLAVNFIYS